MRSAITRRTLLTAALTLPAARWPAVLAAESSPGGPLRRLLLVELNGGNDGLNTVVPGSDPLYARLRAGLAIEPSTLLPVADGLGLNPALRPLHALWERNEVAIVQGLGYAQPNRSHFRSIEIWDTATDSDVTGTRGWLASLDSQHVFGRAFTAPGIVIGRNPAPLSGGETAPIVMTDSQTFASQARSVIDAGSASGNAALSHVLRIQADIRTTAATLGRGRARPRGDFPATPFARDAAEAAALLGSDPVSPVVKIALTGFDTHANQRGRHDALLGQLARTLSALRDAFVDQGIWNDVLIVTYSEFGRRAAVNGSGGTDHGQAAPHFVLGGGVKGGLHGASPRLESLVDGDVPATVDFRRLYNTVLAGWWKAPQAAIEPERFPPLPLV